MVWIENTKNLNFFEHASVSTWGSKFPKMAFFHENLRFLEKKNFWKADTARYNIPLDNSLK